MTSGWALSRFVIDTLAGIRSATTRSAYPTPAVTSTVRECTSIERIAPRALQRRIRQRGINAFILHGPGVRDIHPLSARRHGTIGQFLAEVMFADRAVIVLYDRGSGIRFTDPQAEQDFRTVLKAYDKVGGTNLAQVQPRDPDRAL